MAKLSWYYSFARLVAFSATFSLTMSSCSRYECCTEEAAVIDETYMHKYGMAVPSDFWTASGEDGSVISTLADGVVVSRNYSSGMFHGDTTYTYPH